MPDGDTMDKNLIAITLSSVPMDDDAVTVDDVNDQLRDNLTFMLTEFFHMDSGSLLDNKIEQLMDSVSVKVDFENVENTPIEADVFSPNLGHGTEGVGISQTGTPVISIHINDPKPWFSLNITEIDLVGALTEVQHNLIDKMDNSKRQPIEMGEAITNMLSYNESRRASMFENKFMVVSNTIENTKDLDPGSVLPELPVSESIVLNTSVYPITLPVFDNDVSPFLPNTHASVTVRKARENPDVNRFVTSMDSARAPFTEGSLPLLVNANEDSTERKAQLDQVIQWLEKNEGHSHQGERLIEALVHRATTQMDVSRMLMEIGSLHKSETLHESLKQASEDVAKSYYKGMQAGDGVKNDEVYRELTSRIEQLTKTQPNTPQNKA
tara:strand:+ start:3033 stop:4178 length:1146 start_codon:yes stop_codon:yes gene_type:complete